jgi:hypothetical protein
MNLIRRVKQSLSGAPLILFWVGLIFLGVGGGLTYHQFIFKMDALQAPGEVVGLSESCDDDGCFYSPDVRFTTMGGETVFYHSTYGSNPPEYKVGEVVTIFYKSENPEKAIIAGEGGVFRIIFIGVGGIILLAGLILFGVNLYHSFLIKEQRP